MDTDLGLADYDERRVAFVVLQVSDLQVAVHSDSDYVDAADPVGAGVGGELEADDDHHLRSVDALGGVQGGLADHRRGDGGVLRGDHEAGSALDTLLPHRVGDQVADEVAAAGPRLDLADVETRRSVAVRPRTDR